MFKYAQFPFQQTLGRISLHPTDGVFYKVKASLLRDGEFEHCAKSVGQCILSFLY